MNGELESRPTVGNRVFGGGVEQGGSTGEDPSGVDHGNVIRHPGRGQRRTDDAEMRLAPDERRGTLPRPSVERVVAGHRATLGGSETQVWECSRMIPETCR